MDRFPNPIPSYLFLLLIILFLIILVYIKLTLGGVWLDMKDGMHSYSSLNLSCG